MKRILILNLFLAGLLFAQDPVTWTKNVISDVLEKAKKNVVVDIDLDGDLDIICTANPEGSGSEDAGKANVMLYLNDGTETFSAKVIDYRFRSARGLACMDLNGDGYPDVAVGNQSSDSSLVWYENPITDYENEWTKRHIGSGAPFNYTIVATDLNIDGYMDLVDGVGDAIVGGSAADDYIRWLESDGANPPTFTVHNIINCATPGGIAVADFDGDADKDIVGMAWLAYTEQAQENENVRWWAQQASMSFSQQQVLQTYYGGNSVVAGDMDGDNDQDVLGAGWKSKTVDWWANDGNGSFSSVYTIKTSFTHSRNAIMSDMDSDGDMDVVACADNDSTVSWFENDGSLNFTEHQLTTSFTTAYYVSAADLDGDGDMDVVGTAQDADDGSSIQGQVSWWESDLAEERIIAAGDPAAESFNNSKVVIDFDNGYSGGNTSVFYNHNENSNRSSLGNGIHHIAGKGFYTIVTDANTYSATIDFYYNDISEWSAITDESTLLLCYWDASAGTNGQWEILKPATQTVTPATHKITVSGVDAELIKYSKFTLASSTADNSLPVELTAFKGQISDNKIVLSWKTQSELENQGFEIWRSIGQDTSYSLLASYMTDPDLRGLYNSSVGRDYQFIDPNVYWGEVYRYKLYDVNINGLRTEVARTSVTMVPGDLTRVLDGELPKSFHLQQNYPNPFNSYTIIELSLPEVRGLPAQSVRLTIYDYQGRKVRTLFRGQLAAGTYLFRWDGRNDQGQGVSSGTYIYRLTTPSGSMARKLQYVR